MFTSWMKKTISILIIIIAGLWITTQMPFFQRFLKQHVEKALSTPQVTVTIDHVSVAFPFYLSFQGLRACETSRRNSTLLTCQSLSCSPLLLDLPFHRLTFLRVKAKGVFIDLDAIESLNDQQRRGALLPFSLSISSLHLSSLYVKSHHLPLKEGALDCSIRGRLFLSKDLSHAKSSLSISRNTPMVWPKRLDLKLIKEGRSYSLLSTIFISTEGLKQPKQSLFGPNDRLYAEVHTLLKPDATDFSPNSFETFSGTWKLSCPEFSISLFQDYLLRRSVKAAGKISYLPGQSLTVTCDAFNSVVSVGQTIQVPHSIDGPPAIPTFQFVPIATHSVQGKGEADLHAISSDSLRLRFLVPDLSIDGITAPLNGTLDLLFDGNHLHTSASASGEIRQGSQTIPWKCSSDGEIAPTLFTIGGDLVTSSCRLSSRYESKESDKTLWASLRCENLSLFQPFLDFPLSGSADLSSHLHFSPKKSLLSISGTVSDFLFHTISCKNGTLRVSTDTQTPENISCIADLIGLKCGPLSLDTSRASFRFNPFSNSALLSELRCVGSYNQLTFDLFGSGSGHTDGRSGKLTIDRMEGTVGNNAVTLERPLICEHFGLGLAALSGTVCVGNEGRINCRFQRNSPLLATGDLSIERLPLHNVADAIGSVQASGTFDAMCHYQSTADNVTGTVQAQANISRLGVIGGNEGGLAVGGTLSLDNNRADGTLCIAGMGIKEPLMVTVSTSYQRIPKSPWIFVTGNSPLHGSIKGDIHLSQLLAEWMPSDAGFEAIIGGDLSVEGTVDTPLFHGPVHLRDGRIDLLPTGEVISDIKMDGILHDRCVTVSSITATDDKQGHMSGSGLLDLSSDKGFRWQASLNCSDIEVISLDYATGVADGNVTLVGDLSSITISGSAISKKALIDLAARFPSDVPEIGVTYRGDVKEKSQPFLVFFDLSIDATSPIQIQGRGLSSTWEGHLHLGGEVSNLIVDGILQCRTGTFMVSTKELTISEGTISFAGDLFSDSRLNIIASIALPSITANVSLKGSFKTPKFTLQSTPPKTDNEILSLILFNKEYGDISPLQSLQLANTAMVFQRSSGPFGLLDKLKQTFGIDVLDFGSPPSSVPSASQTQTGLDGSDTGQMPQQGQSDVSLKVGKYISDGVAVTVSKNVTSDANYVGIEAQITPDISAEAEVSDTQEGIVSLKWKKNY